ncbi:MAG: hypothetical protein H0X24_07935 [Ktedonobacterales bacterium]|nr:hypothetical protein [Ktedonobacterales bacterium]
MTEHWDAHLTELELLTGAMQTALLAEDIATFTGLVRGRGPLIDACLAEWESLTEAERVAGEARLRAVLTQDALLVEAGETWLRATRKRLVQLQAGMQATARYGVPIRLH